MNPYDKVHELVDAIKESNEVKEYLALKEELFKDENNKKMIKEFRDKQVEVQSLLMQGKKPKKKKSKNFNLCMQY